MASNEGANTTNHDQVKSNETENASPSAATTSVSSKPIVDDPELDALLDDALLDFGKPLPKANNNRPGVGRGTRDDPGASALDSNTDMNQIWSEEFIKEATAQFEKKMREYAQKGAAGAGPGSGGGPESVNKVVEAAAKAAMGEASPGFSAGLNEAMKSFTDNPDFMDNQAGMSDDDLAKLMNSFSLGENADDADMDEILPFMTNMMQKLLSKELLQPVLADIVDRYPDWLADNREKLSSPDFEKYNKQYETMKNICEEYAKEKETDTETVKQQRFDRISELMLKVQTAGPPPKELVGDMEGNAATASLFGNPTDASSIPGGDCSVM